MQRSSARHFRRTLALPLFVARTERLRILIPGGAQPTISSSGLDDETFPDWAVNVASAWSVAAVQRSWKFLSRPVLPPCMNNSKLVTGTSGSPEKVFTVRTPSIAF